MQDLTISSKSSQEVVLTYEKLYELLRREKGKEELQNLDPQFLLQTVSYLREKDLSYKGSGLKNDVFSMNEHQRLQTELHNIHRLVKELYERREKKIIDMALNRSRTNANIIDTTNLLMEERALFDQMVATLDTFRMGVLQNLLMLKDPHLSHLSFSTSFNHQAPVVEDLTRPAPGSHTMTSANLSAQTAQTNAQSSGAKYVRFLQSVPQVVGMEMETYGPFEPNQTASIPSEIADIWIEQGAAVETS